MRLPRGLRALEHRDFRVFFAAQLLSLIAGWMQTVAQAWLVLSLTDSPLRLGLIGTLQFGPLLLLSLVTGAVADRLPKRRVLLGTQAAYTATALVLGVLVASGHVAYWHVGVIAVITGITTALDQPTRQAFFVDMVGRADAVNAIALHSAAFNAARIVGPAVGGVLLARLGVAPAFFANALGSALLVLALSRVRARGLPGPATSASMLAEIGEGLRYAARTPVIRITLAVLLAVSMCVFNFTVYIPLLARHVLGLGPDGFGFLMAAVGAGAVSGALTVGTVGRRLPLPVTFGAAAAAFLALLGLAAVRHVAAAVPLLFVTGFFGLVVVAGCNTSLLLAAPDAMRGRVMSLYTLVYGGIFPISAFLVGAVSERWGVSRAFHLAGLLGLGVLLALLLRWRAREAP